MPSYLDFSSTKSFRDFIIGKTIKRPNGPQTFTENNYLVKNLDDFSNIDLPPVDANRKTDLSIPKGSNTYKPLEYTVQEDLRVLQRRANLSLYWNGTPYFLPERHNIIGILSNNNYDTESELFKFAARTIKSDPEGPFQARLRQNLEASTVGKIRLLDALNGNTATAFNIVTGREPLIEFNNKITVSSTLPGKGIDFLQTVAGFEFPFTEIPGDYLTNPRNPINIRPTRNEIGSIIQDVTGTIGSLVGIQRRPKQTRKPSDLMIEYLGEGQKRSLYDLLSYSTYAPNYTTTARSQNTSKLFNFIDTAAQGVKTVLGLEAPRGVAYIGDDRGEDVNFAMNDFLGRPVRSSYFLSLLFDPIQTQLFERKLNVSEGGQISGKLTWISRNSKNKLGVNNDEWNTQQSQILDSLSTQYQFRNDSILGKTQELLDSLPNTGANSRTHVGNVIDQTSRIFKEGEVMLSRGSAIKYVDKFGEESGVEYCRVWTKDRGYFNYSDTMKRTGNVRKYDDSVMSTPWNLNIAPMSNGGRTFDGSTNIEPFGDGFRAKKYMLSIENLAWKTSEIPGFTYNDLPYCERGSNGGRIMWFPPYDLKVSEQNNARWEENNFLGRPEPIYTYQNTTRSGQLSFKVVVDHPSILNLLVKEFFKNMSDEEAENYINAFFAGCEEIDFYDLIRRYSTLTPDDVSLITTLLNDGKEQNVITNYRTEYSEPVLPAPEPQLEPQKESLGTYTLNFPNDYPVISGNDGLTSTETYSNIYVQSMGNDVFTGTTISELDELLRDIYTGTTTTEKLHDRNIMLKTTNVPSPSEAESSITVEKNKLTSLITKSKESYSSFTNKLDQLKTEIESGSIQEVVIDLTSTTSAAADDSYNYRLSIRRSHSIVKEIINRVGKLFPDKWITQSITGSKSQETRVEVSYSFKELGYEQLNGKLTIKTRSAGEKVFVNDQSCTDIEFKYKDDKKTLRISSPLAFGCRATTVSIESIKTPTAPPISNPVVPSTLIVDTSISGDIPSQNKKPAIDPMKRIIMKTLSECYYFQKLEESDPVVFGSLKEKLKYFHPAFHSTTPEGLNSRLTFLLQCIRPGDTIPIKGLSEESDVYARNTSFGPPPICVLRVGDFYNTKIIIRDVNITFDETTWDLNPEGIGVQPMIANVNLSITFIGGQGIKTPVNRLQNALSSNFFANTEMYDERSTPTAESINNTEREIFTREFLESLQQVNKISPKGEILNSENEVTEGTIGTLNVSDNTIQYSELVNEMFKNTENYLNTYESTYNVIFGKYGTILSTLLLDPLYRQANEYDYYESLSDSAETLELFGEYKLGEDLSRFTNLLKTQVLSEFDTVNISEFFEFDKVIPIDTQKYVNRLLKPKLNTLIEEEVNKMSEVDLKDIGEKRNNLIKTLDNLNFVVNYGYDVSLISQKTNEISLSGFTSNLLYDEYSSCIELLDESSSKFYEDLDTTSLNFYNPEIDNDLLKTLLSVLLKDRKMEILDTLKVDSTIINDNTQSKLLKKLDKFFNVSFKNKNFKIKIPKRKKENELKFTILSQNELTDVDAKNSAIKTKSTKPTKIINNKLNYFRK
jgi:hypothetical protein